MQESDDPGTDLPMRRLLLNLLLCTVALGCVHRTKPPVPQLLARTCPAGSVEFNGANYCSDPPKCTQRQSIANGDLCATFEPGTGRLMGVFWKGTFCNPFLEQDCDGDDVGIKTKQGKKAKKVGKPDND